MAVGLTALAAFGGCQPVPPGPPEPIVESFAGPTMGTRYSVRYWGPCEASRPELQKLVDNRLAEINAAMSTYDPESELSVFNQSDQTDWLEVSEELAKVVSFAINTAEATDGSFDPTVGPAVNLWGFGPDGRRKEPPSAEKIKTARDRVGYQHVAVRLDPPAIKKSRPDVYIDLSAVAKGYASDSVRDLIAEHGASGCMVEIGGEIATLGDKPGGVAWRIGLEKPDSGGVQRIVKLSGEAVATSGDYRNFFKSGGVRYSHTIDPNTGRPVKHNLATVSVRSRSCMEADAFATALLVMGPVRGYDWAEANGVAAVLVSRTDDGPKEQTTSHW
ncbi:MAG: FAD:protein FMN transferase [Planctomycetota bacterium]